MEVPQCMMGHIFPVLTVHLVHIPPPQSALHLTLIAIPAEDSGLSYYFAFSLALILDPIADQYVPSWQGRGNHHVPYSDTVACYEADKATHDVKICFFLAARALS